MEEKKRRFEGAVIGYLYAVKRLANAADDLDGITDDELDVLQGMMEAHHADICPELEVTF